MKQKHLAPKKIGSRLSIKPKKPLIIMVFLLLTAASVYVYFASQHVFWVGHLSSQTLKLEIADTDRSRVQGLSGRSNLPDGQGLLFVFPESNYHAFWMKDMRFPIDILWFDEHYRLVDVHERVSPDTYPSVFSPHISAQYVLELPAGFFSKYKIKLGEVLQISSK